MTRQCIIKSTDIMPSRDDFEVLGVFNPAAIKFGSETILLVRVAEKPKACVGFATIPIFDKAMEEIILKKVSLTDPHYDFSDPRVIRNTMQNYLTSISHFRLARSIDGINFYVSNTPVIYPDNIYEEYSIEDARITLIEGVYYITYSAVSSFGINVALMRTNDFVDFERMGLIFHSDNKDCVLFPDKVNGKYYALHRPSTSEFGKLNIWLAESDNLMCWGNHRAIMCARSDKFDNYRLGAGSVPFLTDEGYVLIYHAADKAHRYSLGCALLDKNDPSKVLKRSKQPLIEPQLDFEINGFFSNVVFTCGSIQRGDSVDIYYGVCDQNIALAKISLNEIMDNME